VKGGPFGVSQVGGQKGVQKLRTVLETLKKKRKEKEGLAYA